MKIIFRKFVAIMCSIVLLLFLEGNSQFCCKVSAAGTVEELALRLNELETNLTQLQALISECETKNIPTDYEIVNYTVIQRFIEYENEDLASGFLDRAEYNIDYMEELFLKTETALKGYLCGDKKSLDVPRYVTGKTETDGFTIFGNTVNNDMEEENRPVFFTGYGHFADVRTDIPNFENFGTNIIQIEIGPHNVLRKNSDGTVGISVYDLTNDICKNLENAEKSNIAVNLLLSPHYFQDWMIALEEGMEHGDDGGFLEYNIYHPKAKELIELYLRTVITAVKDYKSLHSFCLSNEPVFYSNLDEYNLPFWQNYLKEIYKDVDELNKTYGTAYESLDNVPMPTGVEASAHFYDWMMFNNRMFADWHSWMAGIIGEIAPEIPLHAKVMNMVEDDERHRKFLKNGTDPEMFAEFSDYMGCDGSNYLYQNANGNGDGIITKLKWYDLLTSMKKAPVFNSEDHILSSHDEWSLDGAAHYNADLWQGAVHGRSAATLWIWQRNTTGAASDRILNRADVVATVGKTNLDLNRLSYEISAFQNQDADVAILYSMTSWVYSEQYMDAMDKAYRAATYSGKKVCFVTEKQLAEGALENFEVLIVPEMPNVWDSTLCAIETFIKNGGKTLVLGEDSLAKDEYNNVLSDTQITYVMENSVVMPVTADGSCISAPSVSDIRTKLFEIYNDIGLNDVLLIDAETNQPVSDVEWRSINNNGKYLINICNYNRNQSKNVCLMVNGEKINITKNLISDEIIMQSELELKPFEPVLLSAVEKCCSLEKFWVNNVLIEGNSVSAADSGSVLVKAEISNMKTHPSTAMMIICLKNVEKSETESLVYVKKDIKAGESEIIEGVLKVPQPYQNFEIQAYVLE